MNVAVSACLLGKACRYDGKSKPCADVIALRGRCTVVPVCPEVAGKLHIPHPANEIVAGEPALRVVDTAGVDNTDAFVAGARRTLEKVQERSCHLAILKAKSPSCGTGLIYDGTFSGTLVPGYGVAARLLRAAGVRCIDEHELRTCLETSEARHPGQPPAILAERSSDCPALATERLVLRPLTDADAPDVFAYCRDPQVGPAANWAPHRSIEDSRAFIRDVASAPHVFGIFERTFGDSPASFINSTPIPHGPCIGSIGLIPDPLRTNPDCLMLGYALARPAWGQGLATEAAQEILRYGFEELRLSAITANHNRINDRSRRVIEKCGFEREGIIHQADVDTEGFPVDVVSYILTRESWDTGRASDAGRGSKASCGHSSCRARSAPYNA